MPWVRAVQPSTRRATASDWTAFSISEEGETSTTGLGTTDTVEMATGTTRSRTIPGSSGQEAVPKDLAMAKTDTGTTGAAKDMETGTVTSRVWAVTTT